MCFPTLGRCWRHSTRHDRALDRARRLYEHLLTLDGNEAVTTYRVLVGLTDAWGFELNASGQHLVPARTSSSRVKRLKNRVRGEVETA